MKLVIGWLAPVSASLLSTGCVGLAVDWPENADVADPLPLVDRAYSALNSQNRWSCASAAATPRRASQADFARAWGQPLERSLTDDGHETWRYRESYRWCGIWFSAILPLPLMLPVCDTYDHIEFQDGYAVRATSRRFTMRGAGITVFPIPPFLAVPWPYLVRPGTATDGESTTITLPPVAPEWAKCDDR